MVMAASSSMEILIVFFIRVSSGIDLREDFSLFAHGNSSGIIEL